MNEPRNRERVWLRDSLIQIEQVLRFVLLRRADLGLPPLEEGALVAAWGEVKPLLWEMQEAMERVPHESLRAVGLTGAQLSLKLNSFDAATRHLSHRLKQQDKEGWEDFERCKTHGPDGEIFSGIPSAATAGMTAAPPAAPDFEGFIPFKGVLKKILQYLLNVLKYVNSLLGSLKSVVPTAEMVKEFKEVLENMMETRRLASEP